MHRRSVTTIDTLFSAAAAGDAAAREQLFAALYGELRRVAERELRRSGDKALSPTTVLHETYLAMAGREGTSFPDRNHFLSYAAKAMRGLIIDHVRERCARKRGSEFEFTGLSADTDHVRDEAAELHQVSDALDELANVDPLLAETVDLKYFCGFSFEEIGRMRSRSERTVQRDWEKARLFLHRALSSPSLP